MRSLVHSSSLSVTHISSHRSSRIDNGERNARLQQMIRPTIEAWQAPELERAVADFPSFCQKLGLEQFPQYFLACKASQVEDWSSCALNVEGRRIKKRILKESEVRWSLSVEALLTSQDLPLQATRSLITASTNRAQSGRTHDIALEQWKEGIPIILPRLLQLVRWVSYFSATLPTTDNGQLLACIQ